MRFGIKTNIKKLIYQITHPTFIYRELTGNSFPKNPYTKIQINSRLNTSYNDEKKIDKITRVGTLIARADQYAIKIYQKFITVNPNNIGNWSIKVPYGGTKLLEYEVVQKMIDLYHGQKQNLEGYFTSGGQEGNLYSVWLAKSFITKKLDLQQILLLKTQLTHHSIDKACLISSVKCINIPVSSKTWGMDPKDMESEIKNKIRNGIYGFIISLTFGYAQTGTSDNLKLIIPVIRRLKKQYKKLVVSIIIDAAFNGLIEPFVDEEFKPFFNNYVHAYCIDFSKFTAIPYPAGLVLYRKHLRGVIEQRVSVSPFPDNTLLGSRSGAPVASVWGAIHSYGISGYREIITNQIKIKNYFIDQVLSLYPDAEIVNDSHSLSCGVILGGDYENKLSNKIEEKYWIYAEKEAITFSNGKTRNIQLYKFYFLPHITKKNVDDVILSMKYDT